MFDMDGTLIDSEPRWQASEAAIMESWGGEAWTPELGRSCTGQPLRVTARNMLDHAGRSGDEVAVVDELLHAMATSYRRDGVPWMPGALRLLAGLRQAQIATGLISSSYRILLAPVIDSAGPDVFDVSIAGDEVERAKPHPDPYLCAASRLGLDITECVVVEDSASGMAAARASGARVVGLSGPLGHAWPEADMTVREVGDLTVEALRSC
nr:HAD family phosphatase [Nanchangia anserum]